MLSNVSDGMLDLMAEKLRILADPTRLAILRSLLAGEKCVGRVVEETGRGQANVSKHLKLLAESGLVARRKKGLQVFYRVDSPFVERLCTLVCDTIARDTEEQITRSRELLNTLGGARKSRPTLVP